MGDHLEVKKEKKKKKDDYVVQGRLSAVRASSASPIRCSVGCLQGHHGSFHLVAALSPRAPEFLQDPLHPGERQEGISALNGLGYR